MSNKITTGEKVMQVIEKRQIEPTARWKFVLKNNARWAAAFISSIIGTLGIATLIHVIDEGDWDIYRYFGRDFTGHAAIVFPYFWLAIVALFAMLTYVMTRSTKRGYKFARPAIIITGLLTFAIAGSALYVFGIGEQIDETLSAHSTLYTQLPHHKITIWSHPRAGLLSGTITRIISADEFSLVDFSRHTWTVQDHEAQWTSGTMRSEGTTVKLIGTQSNEQEFSATEIRPWRAQNKTR